MIEQGECYDCGKNTDLVYQGRCMDCDDERHPDQEVY